MNAVDELNALLGIGPPKPRLPITLQRSGYDSIKVLGKGSFGQAYLIYHKATKKYYVAKHVNLAKMDQRQRKEARNEISILQRMRHPNVVRYEESVEQGADLYIVMEYADGGDLYSHINKVKATGGAMTEDQVINLFTQCAMAIKYMHDRKVIHRDVKPQNVFLTKSRVVKLGDFGISTVLTHTMAMATTLCGTPCYFSPELCDSRPYNNKSDVWALGVMLYEMASLQLPFDAPNMMRLKEQILRSQPVRRRVFSDGMWSLIEMMLNKDPFKRPDIDGVLAHPTIVKAMPRIAQLLAAGAPPSEAPSPSSSGLRGGASGGTDEDDAMLALWKAKRDREAAAAAKAGNGQPISNPNANILPTPPAAPPLAAPAHRGAAGVALPPAPGAVHRERTPSAIAAAAALNNNNNNNKPTPTPAPSAPIPLAAGAGMSAAAVERARRDEEYKRLREEMARMEENRRLRAERDRREEAVVDAYLLRREEQQRRQAAAEMAEAELRRAEAVRLMKEKEAREQQAAAEARARDLAAMEAKANAAKEAAERARIETERQAAIVAEREARRKAEEARAKLAAEQEKEAERMRRAAEAEAVHDSYDRHHFAKNNEKQYADVMLSDGPSASASGALANIGVGINRGHHNDEEEPIEDETEGLNAVIRNMQSLHDRSVHIQQRNENEGGGGDEIEDEVGAVATANDATTPKRQTPQRGGGGKPSALNQTIIDEVGDIGAATPPNATTPKNGGGRGAQPASHMFEDPMGTCVNVDEIHDAIVSPAKRAPSNGGATPAQSLSAAPSSSATAGAVSSGPNDDDDEPIQGQCLCGKVEFSGYLSYIYGSFTCTCNLCRRFSGSDAGVGWLHLPSVLFPEVVRPSEALRNFPLGDGRSRCYFCRRCGASIAMEHPGVDGCVISKAALDHKSAELLMNNQRTAR